MTPLGHPTAPELTGTQASDSPRLPGLIAVPDDKRGANFLGLVWVASIAIMLA